MSWFSRSRQEGEAEREQREQEAQRWLDQHNAEKEARAAAREAQAGQPGGGITVTGRENISVSGQAFGHGTEVRDAEPGETGGRGDAGGGQPIAGSHQGPLIVNTGGGQVNVQKSAVGHNVHLINYAEPRAPEPGLQAEQGLEAGE